MAEPPASLPSVAAGIPAALRRAAAEGALPPVDSSTAESPVLSKPVGLFYDLTAWEANLLEVKQLFGEGFFHTLALKSNGLTKMLKRARELGFGTEGASIGEVCHAQRMGFSGSEIVFDSPVKTAAEIRHALSAGVHINIDSFQELAVVAAVRATLPSSTSNIGLRVNPLVGAGAIQALSVSTRESKFGIPIDQKEEILSAFRGYSWLNCMHIHVGSAQMGVRLLTTGVRRLVDLALELNASLGSDQIRILDIGGGMPVNYASEPWHTPDVPGFREYTEALRREVPKLFPGSDGCPFKQVITEFGQSMNAKAGWLASRIEYAKLLPNDGGQVVLIHFGADLCPRQCYTNEHRRRLEFYDGERLLPKEASEACPVGRVHVAGPLCFQGDQLTKGSEVAPRLQRGDIVVMREAGANTMSLFSRHCLRQVPAAYGYRIGQGDAGPEVTEWTLLKPSEDMEGCSRHWGWQPEADDEPEAKRARHMDGS